MSWLSTVAPWLIGTLLLGGLIWAVGRISRLRGEERIGGEILKEQDKASTDWENDLKDRDRLRGDELRERLREMADKG